MADTGNKLKLLLRPLLDDLYDRLKALILEQNGFQSAELLESIERIETRMNAIEVTVGEKKKKATGGKKKAATTGNDSQEGSADKPRKKKYYMNKMQWFKDQYKNNNAFADKYFKMIVDAGEPDLQEIVNADPAVNAEKKTEQQRHTAKVNKVYTEIKDHYPYVLDEILKDYEIALKQYNAENEAEQANPEEHTDDETVVAAE